MAATVHVILNSAAGALQSAKSRPELAGLITTAWPGAAITFTEAGMDVADWARQAVAQGGKLVLAGGGDGTINAVASVLVGTQSVLGVLPLGTLNHFAKELGIPTHIPDAIKSLANGEERPVDVGEVNGHIFVNNSGLGLYPSIVRLREKEQRRGVSKWPAAVWAWAKAMKGYRLLHLEVDTDGKRMPRSTPIVFIGNNEYVMEGLKMGTRSTLDAGRLCLYMPRIKGRGELLWLSTRALLGLAKEDKIFEMMLATEFTIASRHTHLNVTLDGEVRDLPTPLKYASRPKSLRVLVPRKAR